MTRRARVFLALAFAGVLGWVVIRAGLSERRSVVPEESLTPELLDPGDALAAGQGLPTGERSSIALEAAEVAAEASATSDPSGIESGLRVYGRIVDAQSGLPLKGVRVWLRGRREEISDLLEIGKFVTGPDGRYEFNPTGPFANFFVGTRRAGYADSAELLFIREASELEWNGELDAGLVAQLLAFDPIDGRPVSGAVVRWSSLWDPLGVAGADGRIAARLNRERKISVEVEAEGFLQTQWNLPLAEFDPDRVYRIPLAPCAWVEGRIYAGEASVAGATVDTDRKRRELPKDAAVRIAAESEPGSFRWRTPQPFGVQTDREGRYRIALLPHREPYWIEVQADGFGKAQSPPFEAPFAGNVALVNLELREEARLFGMIRRNGKVLNARVSVSSETQSFYCQADEDGSYSIGGLPAGSYVVSLTTYPAVLPNPVEPVELWLEAGERRQLDIEWEEEITTISGTVRSPIEGLSFGHTHVRCWPTAEGEISDIGSSASIRADGTFEIRVPPAVPLGDLLTLAVDHSQLGTGRVKGVEAGAKDVELVLEPPPFVRLSVIDPETGAALSAHDLEGVYWRADPEAKSRRLPAMQDPWGEQVLFLPVPEDDRNSPGEISLAERGYAPVVFEGVLPINGAIPGPILEVVLQPVE